ncbi:hypothetical protein Tco_1349817 [Tanacetum coccineum]
MNFILNQEERVKQLEEYMSVIGLDFMQLSSEVIAKLKEEIRVKESRIEKIEKITRPQWVNLFQINELVYRELVREFFTSFEFKDYAFKGNPKFKGVSFRMGGEYRTMSLLELGWRVGLYSEEDSLDDHTRLSRKESTQRITAIDMFYLYCIYAEGVVCDIPYWLARYLRRARDMNVLCGGMFVTRIAQSFGFLSREMDQQDERWGPMETWMTRQTEQAN